MMPLNYHHYCSVLKRMNECNGGKCVPQRVPVQGRGVHPGQLPGHQRHRVAPLLDLSGARVAPEGRLPRRSRLAQKHQQ